MSKLTLIAPGPLTATADPRVKRGLLLPYGEHGLTNKGKVLASAGALTLAEKLDPLTLEHAPKLGVADFVSFEESGDGLYCSVSYLPTPLGDAALAEYESGKRAGLSVEVDEPVIRAGRLVAGRITGGSQVETPAFPSAKLAAAEMDDAPDEGTEPEPDPETPDVVINGKELDDVETVEVTPERITVTTKTDTEAPAPDETKEPAMTAARVQNPALLGAGHKKTDKGTLFASLATNAPYGQARLEAALSDIVPGDILGIEQPQYVGELWDGKAYERRIVPLFNHADLTSFKVQGWRWKTKPEVAAYSGNKTAVPSNSPETEGLEIEAYRLAGAHDIDRKFKDFPSPEFWAAYYQAMTESTAKQSDIAARNEVVAAASRVHLLTGTAPAGVPTALWQIVRGVRTILDTLEVLPQFALVESDYWEPIMFTPATDVLVYLDAMLGLKEGTLNGQGDGFRIIPVPVGSLTVPDGPDAGSDPDFVGKTLVGCRDAVTVHELGGGAPIRVEAPNIAQGGVDSGVFYYGAVNIHSEDGLVLFDAPSA